MKGDTRTADAFANSWNNLPLESVYTKEQFEDWMSPIGKADIEGKNVLELGCGNASLLVHIANWKPEFIEGVDLGHSVKSASGVMGKTDFSNWKITKSDLVTFQSEGFDFVYCIGVLHHLKNPKSGLDSVIRNTKKGGKFHCWVYAREGNGLIVYVVDPVRKIVSHLPWWFTKYFVATPVTVPFYLYAKIINSLRNINVIKKMPLYNYLLWISKREFRFFRHVAFDQLVTPQTTYIKKKNIVEWLKIYKDIDQDSTYIICRNGNSWKFGGTICK